MSQSRLWQGKRSNSLADLRLPPIPKVLPKILDHLHTSEFANPEGVLSTLRCDPELEEKLLGRINSQLPRSMDDVEQAIGMVGATTAAGIIIKLSMSTLNTLRRGPAGSCVRQLIQHSEATAVLARRLLRNRLPESADRRGISENEDLVQSAFAKGFVHDLGKLVLIYNDPEKGAALYGDDWIEDRPEEVGERDLERRAFGHDHTEAGAYAATELDVPEGLVVAARDHHDPGATPDGSAETWDLRAVRAANLITKAMGPSVSGLYAQNVSLDWATCANHSDWLHWETSAKASPKAFVRDDFILYSEFFLDSSSNPRRLSS